MTHRVVVLKEVQKQVEKLPKLYRLKVAAAFLESDPYFGKKLKGEHKDKRSIKVWPYRVLYRIEPDNLTIAVLSVEHRQGVY